MDLFRNRHTEPTDGPDAYVPPAGSGGYVPPPYETTTGAAPVYPTSGPVADAAPLYDETPAYTPPRAEWAERTEKGRFVEWAFYSGIGAGVLILLCAFSVALLMTVMGFLGGPSFAWPWLTDPDGAGPAANDAEWSPVVPFVFALWGLLTGGMVLVGALRLKENPHASALPGAIILVGGLLSFLVFGGFLLGGLLAIASGVLAIAGARSPFLVRGPRIRGNERPPSV